MSECRYCDARTPECGFCLTSLAFGPKTVCDLCHAPVHQSCSVPYGNRAFCLDCMDAQHDCARLGLASRLPADMADKADRRICAHCGRPFDGGTVTCALCLRPAHAECTLTQPWGEHYCADCAWWCGDGCEDHEERPRFEARHHYRPCGRCGRFHCRSCTGGRRLCPDCRRRRRDRRRRT